MKVLKKLGFQALFDFEDAFHAVEFAIERGFKCVELNQTNPDFFPENYSQVQRKRLKDYLFPILIHAPEGLSLFNLNKKALDGAIERVCEIIDFAHEIGAKGITMHLGSTFTISTGGKMEWIHHILAQRYADSLDQSLKRIIEYADHRVDICIENTSGFRYEISYSILADLLSKTELCMTWDIGHTHELKGSEKAREEGFFIGFLNKVKEVHVHDNHGEWDEHNVPGTGTLDFKHYFEILTSADPYYIIEVRPADRAIKSLEALKAIILTGGEQSS
jgi:sugar phosphate isomerase/epimerase